MFEAELASMELSLSSFSFSDQLLKLMVPLFDRRADALGNVLNVFSNCSFGISMAQVLLRVL